MADATYNEGLQDKHYNDWASASIEVLLLDNADSPTFDATHTYVADVLSATGNSESSGTGYSRKSVPSRTVTRDDANNRAELDHGDITYSGADFGEIGAAVYYRLVTDDTDSPVWFYKTSGFPAQTNGADFTLSTGSAGLVHDKDQ
jgi:hypothetical protein